MNARKRLVLLWACAHALCVLGCKGFGYNLPPTSRMMAPGPGVTGPGPGVLSAYDMPPADMSMGGGMAGDGGAVGIGCEDSDMAPQSAQVLFAKPEGMNVSWDVSAMGQYDSEPLTVPGRQNLSQSSLFRFKLTNVPGHEGVELYPTVEIGPPSRRSQAFLAHNAIPIQFTAEDLGQVTSGNYVTKVIYLPDPEYQALAVAGVDTLVSTQLDPGVDPIVEADRRGVILAVIRVGNKDLEMPGMEMENGFAGPLLSERTTGVVPAGCLAGGSCQSGGPTPDMMGGPMSGGGGGAAGMPGGPVMGPIAGVNGLPFGMPITGTPIGLPGPPHIPLGVPAGLQKHVIKNHTRMYLPDPTEKIKIHVKQSPRVAYPTPRSRGWIHQYDHPFCGKFSGASY